MAETTTIDKAPQNIRDAFNKGLAALERQNLDYAIEMFSGCITASPTLIDVRKYLRTAEILKFKQKKSNFITHAIITASNLPAILQAYTLYHKGKPLEAIVTIEKLLKVDPLNKTFISLYCNAAEAAGMVDLSIQILEVARDHYPDYTKFLTRLGNIYIDTKNASAARACFEQVLKKHPDSGEALRDLKNAMALESITKDGWADVADGKGDYRKLLKDADQAKKLEADQKAVRSTTDTDTLIQETLAKIQKEPKNINYYRALANLYATTKNFAGAVETLQKAQEMRGGTDPELDATLLNIRVQQYDEEINAIAETGDQAAVDAKVEERNTYYFENLQERAKKYPNDLELKYDYGVALFEHGMINEAIVQFQAAQKNAHRRQEALYCLGICFKHKGQADMARKQFESAISDIEGMTDLKKDLLYELALLLEETGNPDEARKFYIQVYEADISYKDVAQKVEGGPSA